MAHRKEDAKPVDQFELKRRACQEVAQEVLKELRLETGMSVGCCCDQEMSPSQFVLVVRRSSMEQPVCSDRFDCSIDIDAFEAKVTEFLQSCKQGFLGLAKVVSYANGLAAQPGRRKSY